VKVEAVVLNGSVVRLEPLRRTHLQALCKVGLDPSLWELIPTRVTTREQMAARVEVLLAAAQTGREIPLVIIERASGTLVGCSRFMNIDHSNRRLEIGGTWIGRPWQRTAVNTETWQCLRVEFKTDALNVRSRRAILRTGAKEEGTLRRHVTTWDGRQRDTVYFSILVDEWPSVRSNLAAMLNSFQMNPS
jgi:RimJ/RimL family protein N-acetyltransferase